MEVDAFVETFYYENEDAAPTTTKTDSFSVKVGINPIAEYNAFVVAEVLRFMPDISREEIVRKTLRRVAIIENGTILGGGLKTTYICRNNGRAVVVVIRV